MTDDALQLTNKPLASWGGTVQAAHNPTRPPLNHIRSASPPASFARESLRRLFGGKHHEKRERCKSEVLTPRSDATIVTEIERSPEGSRSSPWSPVYSLDYLNSRTELEAAMEDQSPTETRAPVPFGSTNEPVVSLMDVLTNRSKEPTSLRSLLHFAKRNLMDENVLFYLEVNAFKTAGGDQTEYLTHVKRIHDLYIMPTSAREINISGDIHIVTSTAVSAVLNGRSISRRCSSVGALEMKGSVGALEMKGVTQPEPKSHGGTGGVPDPTPLPPRHPASSTPLLATPLLLRPRSFSGMGSSTKGINAEDTSTPCVPLETGKERFRPHTESVGAAAVVSGGGERGEGGEQDGGQSCRPRIDKSEGYGWLDGSPRAEGAGHAGGFDGVDPIEELGLGEGPGGGFGNRTIFDSAHREIYDILKTEVFPKFLSGCGARCREGAPAPGGGAGQVDGAATVTPETVNRLVKAVRSIKPT